MLVHTLVAALLAAATASPSWMPSAPVFPAPVATTAAAVCNTYCDGRDPQLATADRQPVSATVFSRRITLHFDDSSVMGWASTDNGTAADEVWLDRSFDGGRTWPGSRLGVVTVPAQQRGWRTTMYNVDDWATSGVGALRACGRAAGRPEIACTPWARTTWNATDRRRAAATALMMNYNTGSGLFATTGWWNSAVALGAVIENARVTGMASYRYAIATTYDRQRTAYLGEFRNDLLDDTGWWALTWIAAYDLTGDARYLTTAKAGAEHMARYWDGVCGGGVWWSTGRTYKNAITNSLYIHVNAAIHRRTPGDTVYGTRALDGWRWFQGTGMINGSNLVEDGIDGGSCRSNRAPVWTYNQGELVDALTELTASTGDTTVMAAARRLADAGTASSQLNPGGILRELCEDGDCGNDGPSFKGVFARGIAALNAVSGGTYTAYLRRQADAAYARDRNELDAYGLRWNGPIDRTDAARQQSAVDLMNAAG